MLCKVIVVGDVGVGKTSLIKRYVHNIFQEGYKATIGVDFALKQLKRHDMDIKLQMWDIAGQERFASLTGVYFRDAIGAVIVFDVARHTTLQSVEIWKKEIDERMRDYYNTFEPFPTILIANKIDLKPKDWEKQKKEIDEMSSRLFCIDSFEASAKQSIGIEEAMHALIDEMIAKSEIFSTEKDEDDDNLLLNEEVKEGCAC